MGKQHLFIKLSEIGLGGDVLTKAKLVFLITLRDLNSDCRG